MKARILAGDCRKRLTEISDASVDSVVTDPPYHLTTGKKGGTGEASVNLKTPHGRARVTTGFMGMTWDGGDIAHDPAVWAECLRVLKPGGYLLSFGGSRTYHRMACGIEDAGFEIRDQIMWIYGSGFPKSLNLGDGWGTALKPAHEPIVMARRPLEGTVAANMHKWGTGALNINDCRIGVEGGSHDPNGGGIHRYNKILHEHGYRPSAYQPTREGEESSGKTYAENGATDFAMKPGPRGGDPLGRWPANVIHDGSEGVVKGFPQTASGEMKAGTVRAAKDMPGSVCYGTYGGNATDVDTYADSGSAARFFYCAKADREERNAGCHDVEEKPLLWSSGEQSPGTFQAEGTHRAARNNHPTVKPIDLMRYLCRLVTPTDGTVLDPFMGSGTTGIGALLEGFNFIGIELQPSYVEIAERRIHAACPMFNTVEVVP